MKQPLQITNRSTAPLARCSRIILSGLVCLSAFGNASYAQTSPRAQVIARPKMATPIAHLDIAPGDRWMLSSSGMGDDYRLWDLKAPNNPRVLPGQYFAWSRDGARLVTWDDPKLDLDFKGKQRLTILDLPRQKASQFSFDLPTANSALSLEFAADGRDAVLRASNYKRTLIWNLDARTGKLNVTKETQGSRTMTATSTRNFVESGYKEVGRQVQVYDWSGRKIYSWRNPSEYDGWSLSSDGALMWRASANTGRFNFYDALSGKLLWRLPTDEYDSGTFGHYPQWSGGGKVVGFVEGQNLRIYEARNGKVLRAVSGNSFGRNALARNRDAYAISGDGKFAMIADAKNQLWRVALR